MIKSVERVSRILDLLKKHPEGLTHTQIASFLKIPHSSLSALLSDMVEIQYLSMRSLDRRFLLGPQLAVLAGGFLYSQETVRIGRPLITRLSHKIQESSALLIPIGWDLLFAVRENGPQHIISSFQVGDTAPIYALPAGRAMLACMSAEKMEECISSLQFKTYTEQTITDVETLKNELPQIRRQGFAYTRDQIKVGFSAFGVPVFDITGKPSAGIDVIVPNSRLSPEKVELITSNLRHMAADFSLQLGFSADLHTGMEDARNMYEYA